MLAKRIIPCLDVTEGHVVKGTKFLNLKYAGDPVALAAFYDREGADELIFLDITASAQKRDILLNVVSQTSEKVFIPFTVGGGIYDTDWIRKILGCGADKISINTAAVRNPNLVKEASCKFGSQCVVVAIDAKAKPGYKLKWEVYVDGGRTPTGIDAQTWAEKVEKLGAGEILLTSMDRDGTRLGYDLNLTRAISTAVKIPVIASGGVGNVRHIYEGLTSGGASAALLASLLHYRELTIKQIKNYLISKKLPIRKTT